MAKLIDPLKLMESPKNTPMYVETRGAERISFRVAWRYDEPRHAVGALGHGAVAYDIDEYNRRWRAWDGVPTTEERRAAEWLQR